MTVTTDTKLRGRTRTIAACLHAAMADQRQAFAYVPSPVDVTDADMFPNIAEAIEHARKGNYILDSRNALG